MASEHEHSWGFYPDSNDTILGLCMFPGCHEKKHIPLQETSYTTVARYSLADLEQQLAQAREENARLTAEKAETLREFALRLRTKTDGYEAIFKQQRDENAQAREEAEKGTAAQHENALLRQEIERWKEAHEYEQERAIQHATWLVEAREENAQAQALLDEVVQDLENPHFGQQFAIDKLRAFLSAHPGD